MEYLQQFIDEHCVIDDKEKIKIHTTQLVKAYQKYLTDNKLSTQKIKDKKFKTALMKLYPHIDVKKNSVYYYRGITIKGYVPPDNKDAKMTKKMADQLRNREKQLKTREIAEDIVNDRDVDGKKRSTRVGSNDKLYMLNAGLDPKDLDDKIYYFTIYRHRLISYVANKDGSINWPETVKETNRRVAEFNETNSEKIERPNRNKVSKTKVARPIQINKISPVSDKSVHSKPILGKLNRSKEEEVSDVEKEIGAENKPGEQESKNYDEIDNRYYHCWKIQRYENIYNICIPIYDTYFQNSIQYTDQYPKKLGMAVAKLKSAKIPIEQKEKVQVEIVKQMQYAQQNGVQFP